MPDAQNVHVHAHTRDEPVASLDHAVGSLMSLATELASMISGTCTAVSNTSGGSSNSRSGSPRIPLTFDDCDEARTRSQVLLALAQLEQTGIKISMLVEHHRGVDRVDAASVAAAEEDTVRAVALPPSAQSEIVNLLEVYRTRLATIVEALDTVPESRGRLLM